MKKATSFIGEHTTELAIVPILKKILHNEFEFVTPIFPWMTREGGTMSKYLHKNDKFKIFGVYPRRPKMTPKDKESIYLKINEQIIIGARSGLSLGIPIIAGCPLVRNFWELGKTPDCLWINLDFSSNVDIEFQIKQGGSLVLDESLLKRIFHGENELINYIIENVSTFTIDKALDAFRKIKMDSINLEFYSSFAFWGGYKPIYFLLK